MKITFVTSNLHKAREAAGILNGIAEVEHVELECPEIRNDSVAEVAKGKAAYAYEKLGRPVITDDTGFFVSALNGFPGSCAAFVQKTIGNEGILCLLSDKTDKSAWFETGIAYADEDGVSVFVGRIDGTVVSPKGVHGFGYDPIFSVGGKTLAEMSEEEKNAISHRSRGFLALRNWLVTR
ncbi:RdgB/HAM1 family non-canonical purine NTP pyrophosphatase [Methanospirillum lacunae]|uniref:Non-canonical purine NTP pyrophosphatase, RdgB/HAM1 family n=1 Tax=Methanospirillum lacunae TaxID=668570 RepID=A0A2V2N2I9_9EURY|nr:RdgB/HAM1 family non-canonical purine NTP pyrophosphatase [Methanospirillum lacunae]PWR71936.1 non-canonical purine NTP pyrophosphatase, RdgB/HAM1 family [Methanospirillum lacunae]